MTTPLHGSLRRAMTIDGRDYVVLLTPETLKLTLKGKRTGIELRWAELVNGEAALATALRASIGKISVRPMPPPTAPIAGAAPGPRPRTAAKAQDGTRKKSPRRARTR